MIDTETGHEMVEVSGHDKKEYASKGVAGTGLGLGIAGTALWLLSGGLGGGLFGNRMGAAGAVAAGVEKVLRLILLYSVLKTLKRYIIGEYVL